MGVIQSAIGQALGTLGIAARLSPDTEERARLAKQERSLARQQSIIESTPGPVSISKQEELMRSRLDTAKKRFEIDPTTATYQNLQSVQKDYDYIKRSLNVHENRIATRAEQARARSIEAAEAKAEQRKKHEEFTNIFTEGGRYR